MRLYKQERGIVTSVVLMRKCTRICSYHVQADDGLIPR
jgi:hypothetical protein